MFRPSVSRALRRKKCCPSRSVVLSCCKSRALSTHLPTVDPPVSSALHSDAYQLLSTAKKSGAAENELFDKQVKDVEAWWATPRFEGIKRPYSAQDVVGKRGSLQQTYPSSLTARKLFNLLKERVAAGEPVHTSMLKSQPNLLFKW